MAKKVKPLTCRQVAKAGPMQKVYKLFDGGGLFLQVNPSGSKYWKIKLRQGGREKVLALGKYPELGITAARKLREDIRRSREETIPLPATSFEYVAREWLGVHATRVSAAALRWYRDFLERKVFPKIGNVPVKDLGCPDFLGILKEVEMAGHSSNLKRAKIALSLIMRHAVASGVADYDPIPALKGVFRTFNTGHYSACVEPGKLSIVLKALDFSRATFQVKSGLRLLPYVFVRPGELCRARWSDIDFVQKEWRYVTGKTKTPHIVPLCAAALRILETLHQKTGGAVYVFDMGSGKHFRRDALRDAMRKCGIAPSIATPHGFRATARTLLEEVLNERYELIEHQLSHTVRDPNGRAYNRTTHLKERKRMMERWGQYLDNLRRGSFSVPPFNPFANQSGNRRNSLTKRKS